MNFENNFLIITALKKYLEHKKCIKKLRFQSSYLLDTPIIGNCFNDLTNQVNEFVDKVELLPRGPDGYVPTLDLEKEISEGKNIDCAFSGLSYSFIQNSIYELYTSVPFGLEPEAYISYIFKEGALDRLNKEAEKDNLYFYPMCLLPPETGGWFQKEINTIEDFKGIKMRIYGIGRQILQELGAETFLIPQNQIKESTESGSINACEFSTIQIDDSIDLPQLYKYWYAPSWNQLSTVLYFVINLDVWKSLTDKQREHIQIMCKEELLENYLFNNDIEIEFVNKYKEQLRIFNDDVLDGLRNTFNNILDKPENIEIKEEYNKMREYQEKFFAYQNLMSKNII